MTTAAKPAAPTVPTTPAPAVKHPEPPPAVATPTDAEQPPVRRQRRRSTNEFTIFDDGGGPFRIYQIVGANEKFPHGSLVPIDGIGGFASTQDALSGLKKHADVLVGKQVMVLRGIHIVSVEVETNPRVKLDSKPRVPRATA